MEFLSARFYKAAGDLNPRAPSTGVRKATEKNMFSFYATVGARCLYLVRLLGSFQFRHPATSATVRKRNSVFRIRTPFSAIVLVNFIICSRLR